MSSDEKIQQEANILLQEYTFLQKYIEELSTYLNNINTALMEASLARRSMEELSKVKGKEILVSLDRNGNAFIKTEIKEEDKVIVSIGGDYYLHTSIKKAMGFLDEKISELEESRKSVEKELSNALNKMNQIKQQLTVLQEKLSKKRPQK